jgi:uncharacterized membrane protein YecN with MAPEG domain
MIIVPAYASLFALLFIILSARTIMARRFARVALGTGRNKALERTVRAHANFAEYVPFTLLLISFSEQRGTHYFMIHLLCVLFLTGRTLHAWGVSQEPENFRYRVTGMMLTFATLAVSALSIGYSYIS